MVVVVVRGKGQKYERVRADQTYRSAGKRDEPQIAFRTAECWSIQTTSASRYEMPEVKQSHITVYQVNTETACNTSRLPA